MEDEQRDAPVFPCRLDRLKNTGIAPTAIKANGDLAQHSSLQLLSTEEAQPPLPSLLRPAAPAERKGRGAGRTRRLSKGGWREKEKGENESRLLFQSTSVFKILL
jgi:hypothetical protein